MPPALTKGMYEQTCRPANDLFGLKCGQKRYSEEIFRNAGWYNKFGERIGWGSLSAADCQMISDTIAENELFIVLCEYHSYWAFKPKNALAEDSPARPEGENIDADYLVKHAVVAISRDQLYWLTDAACTEPLKRIRGVSYRHLQREALRPMVSEAARHSLSPHADPHMACIP